MKIFSNLQTCKLLFNPLVLTILGIFLIGSCAKDNAVPIQSSAENVSNSDEARIRQIENFTAAMKGHDLTQKRTNEMKKSEYTPEEFLKNTEESVNYTYAIPFIKYWDIETKKDTIIIPIINCKILASEGPSKYQLILDKITCRYICSNLTNKKLKYVKVSLISKACTAIKVEVITSIGSTNVSASLSEPNPPGPSSFATYRREFNHDREAHYGTCSSSVWGDPVTSTDLAEMATYNIIGGNDFVHTLVNIETRQMNHYLSPQANWWHLSCFDPNWNQCEFTINCSNYWNISPITGNINYDDPTQLGIDEHCLTISELNSILVSTENYCKGQANAVSKDFVDVNADWTFSLCGDYNHFWYGLLTIGNKIYRNNIPIELSGNCNCQ